MWAEHPVAQLRYRAYMLHRPIVGELILHGELIALPEEPSCCGLDLFAATRRYRTIQIQAGAHNPTAADPLPHDLRAALQSIHDAG